MSMGNTSKWTNDQIIDAYRQTGSVWGAGKHLGLAGQTIHERLKAINYPLFAQHWTEAEIEELTELAGELTITQIANRLGRPYNGVAIKISRLGLGNRYTKTQKRKLPRDSKYNKPKLAQYIDDITTENIKINAYARKNGLDMERLAYTIQKYFPEWWEDYSEANAVKPKTNCPYCEREFYPLSHKQIYCDRKCASDARTDHGYFGGKRRQTIGLAEKTCQLCGRKDVQGLSSHHMIGKENDPDNQFLIALCRGCHQIVTWLGGRTFTGEPEVWEALIQLVLIRKHGYKEDFHGVYCYVDIDYLTAEDVENEN